MKTIFHFVLSMWTWVRSGAKLLPNFMIDLRHSVCGDCEHKKRSWFRHYCNVCKCTINRGRHPFNKLAHPCESCPLGKWSQVGGYGCVDEIDTSRIRVD